MKVHYLFFAVACLLLAGVTLDAKIQADELSALSDGVLRMPGNLTARTVRTTAEMPLAANAKLQTPNASAGD